MKSWAVAAIPALFLAVAPAWADSDWISFKGAGNAFTVELPRSPAITTKSTETNANEIVPLTEYLIDDGNVALIVMDGDFSAAQSAINVDSAVKGMQDDGRVLKSESVIQLDGHEGRYVLLVDKNGFQIAYMAFIIGRHFYQAISVLPKDATQAQAAETARFAASFHFPAE